MSWFKLWLLVVAFCCSVVWIALIATALTLSPVPWLAPVAFVLLVSALIIVIARLVRWAIRQDWSQL
jgi:hypothetical protein